MRFLGRRVYLGAVVLVASVLRHGTKPWRAARLRKLLGVGTKTLARWRAWWREAFGATGFWKAARARFDRPVAEREPPTSLLERFQGNTLQRLVGALRFFAPLTTTSATGTLAEGRG